MTVAYLSHPLEPANGKGTPLRQDDISNALDWYTYLNEVTSWCVTVPWLVEVIALGELHRPRTYTCKLIVLGRCDLLVLVGGTMSSHMRHDEVVARRNKIAVVDLIDLGRRPPREDLSAARSVIAYREKIANQLVAATDRGD